VARANTQEYFADIIAIVIILTGCFLLGVIVRTKVGSFVQDRLENRILAFAPGYPTIKSIVRYQPLKDQV